MSLLCDLHRKSWGFTHELKLGAGFRVPSSGLFHARASSRGHPRAHSRSPDGEEARPAKGQRAPSQHDSNSVCCVIFACFRTQIAVSARCSCCLARACRVDASRAKRPEGLGRDRAVALQRLRERPDEAARVEEVRPRGEGISRAWASRASFG